MNSKTVPIQVPIQVPIVEKPFTLAHPDVLVMEASCPPTDVVYTEYTNSIYQKYAGRDWADITDSDEE
jgi:hypothetical protein